jgi:GMP synthase (glutamine-hydrolysing)
MGGIVCLQHDRGDGPGLIEAWAAARGEALTVLTRAEALPPRFDGVARLIILGGRAGARDEDPRLAEERACARAAAQTGVPVLGLCLGAQMLAVEFGGDVVPRGAPEHGWTAIDGADETFAALFSTPRPLVFSWHNDAIVLPPGATLLARSETCAVQGFRLHAPGLVTGLQFHLEADAAKIALFRRAGKRDGTPADDEAAAIAARRDALFTLLDGMLSSDARRTMG